MKMLQCEACQTITSELAKDVKYLVETEKMWKPKTLRDRIAISCGDPNIAQGAVKDACGFLIGSYSEAIARELALRWNEDSDEFEEDIIPKPFCMKIGAC